MSVLWKVVQKPNPQDQTEPHKYYAMAKIKETIDLDGLAELMSDGGTVRQSDTYAVLISLVNVIKRQLKNGKQVRLGGLGTLYISLNSDGFATEDEVTANAIKRANLRYRPTKEMKDMLKTLQYLKDSLELPSSS